MRFRRLRAAKTTSSVAGGNALHAFVPGSDWLFRASGDLAELWNEDGEGVPLPSFRGRPSAVAVSVDGKFAAIGYREGVVRVIDLTSKKSSKSVRVGRSPVEGLAFTNDALVVLTDKTVWLTTAGKKLAELKNAPYRGAAAADGTLALSSIANGICVVAPGKRTVKWLKRGNAVDVGISRDGSRIAGLLHAKNEGYELTVWDGATALRSWRADDGRIWAVTSKAILTTHVEERRGHYETWADEWDQRGKRLASRKLPAGAADAGAAFDGKKTVVFSKRLAVTLG